MPDEAICWQDGLLKFGREIASVAVWGGFGQRVERSFAKTHWNQRYACFQVSLRGRFLAAAISRQIRSIDK